MLVIVGAGLSVLIAAGYSSAQETTTVIDSTTTTSTVTEVPDITSISPTSHEAAEFELTIEGANFDDVAEDLIYTMDEQELIVQSVILSRSSTQLVVRENMIDFTPGTYIIKVKNSDGVLSNGKELVITVPSVTSSSTTSTIRPTTSSSSSTTTSAAVTTTTARSTTTSTIRPTTSSSSSTTTTAARTTTSTTASTISITLGWSPNTESDIGGYIIYYGLNSRNYTFTNDVGNQTSGTVTGLELGRTYYFALKAYNTSGLYSDYSAEITYPPVAGTTTTIGANTSTTTTTIGANTSTTTTTIGANTSTTTTTIGANTSTTTTTIGANTSTTTAVSRGGGGGGGGGGSYSPTTTTTTTTTTILVKTTSTTTTIPKCLNDSDCDDGSFCSGKETCLNGICVAGQSPCAEGQVCNDDADECRDTVKLTAYFLPPTISRPLLLAKRCTWLLLISSGKNNFNENSIIDFSGPSGEAAGLKLNPDRKPFAIGSFIFLPVCIQKDAVAGKVMLTIRSEAHENNTTIEEVIETSFMVQ
jgi:hypothetical protein